LRFFQLLKGCVIRVYVGCVMLAVVQLHDLAGDGGLEGAIVIYENVQLALL
jgi:hypothetical protein